MSTKLSFQGADFTGQNGWIYGEQYICPWSSFQFSGYIPNFIPRQALKPNYFAFAGWGRTSESGASLAEKLLELEVTLLLFEI